MLANTSSRVQSTGRKRVVTSCTPCYLKKQKCNRRYPCDHCSRRRRPEQCVYHRRPEQLVSPHRSISSQTSTEESQGQETDGSYDYSRRSDRLDFGFEAKVSEKYCDRKPSLVDLFGYFEDSETNTVALLRKLNYVENTQLSLASRDRVLSQEMEESIQLEMERMPDRQTLDFLVQFFVAEVNWMDQLIYPPSFLAQYEKWWARGPPKSVSDVEFAVLLLRMCAYALQFLPSPSYTVDRIRGVSLADICSAIDDAAESLVGLCNNLSSKGSLTQIQHLSFAGLRFRCEGKTNSFLETLGASIQVAQKAGLRRAREDNITHNDTDELQKEMQRRAFCNLYIWDSLLSRQLDRVPFLPDDLKDECLPQMHLGSDFGDTEAPDPFSERLLQAHLARFWRSQCPKANVDYDATVAEERYDKFCTEYLGSLPHAFALRANNKWDKSLPTLPMQRLRLHITILDSICWNFRPVLLLQPNHVACLPLYKQVLVLSQKKRLALASLRILGTVTTLHSLMGASHTRFTDIVYYTFEAAVLLVFLSRHPDFPGQGDTTPGEIAMEDPVYMREADLSKERCSQAAHEALVRLRMLADVSEMAEAGARTLTQLLDHQPENLGSECDDVGVDALQALADVGPLTLELNAARLPEHLLLDHSETSLWAGFPATSAPESGTLHWGI